MKRRSWHPANASVAAVGDAAPSWCSRCGGGLEPRRRSTTVTTSTAAPTTTTVAPPIAPLTGLSTRRRAALTRPALSVKVENTPTPRARRPGIDQADVVYEEVVEGSITRFVAIFNSTVPDVIGPVRSVRAEDPDIVWPIGGVFAYSGGAPVNVDAINDGAGARGRRGRRAARPWCATSPTSPRATRRTTSTASARRCSTLGGDPVPPTPLFQYLAQRRAPRHGPRA